MLKTKKKKRDLIRVEAYTGDENNSAITYWKYSVLN